MENRIKINDVWYVREDTQKKRPYMLGDTFGLHFDYEGMLNWGVEIDENTHVNILEDLLTSFEDVNYHKEAAPLYDLIEHRKYQNEYGENEVTKQNILESLCSFRLKCKRTLNDIKSDLSEE